ncbi:MAG: thioredoxin family protein [Methanomassiliicoccus sp.]|nr:thioredoxin family protein [Methanomassiliicoccus sp.]
MQDTRPVPLTIGQPAPNFEGLLSVDGRTASLSSFAGKQAIIIVFMANRCTAAQAYVGRMIALQDAYGGRGMQLVAINSDSPSQNPSESYLEMIEMSERRGFNFPYLKDVEGAVARAYGAQLTLHAFLLDQGRILRYRGRIDDSPNAAFVTTNDLRNALDDVLAGREVAVPETAPFPCGIDKFVSCPSCGSRLES